MSDRDLMKAYWNDIGRRENVNHHIAHIDDTEEFFKSGLGTLKSLFPGGIDGIPAGSRVLEIGCGKGRITRMFAQLRPDIRVFGIDVSSSMIDQAYQESDDRQNLVYCVGDGVSLGVFPSSMFDVVYSYIVFQHLPRHIVQQYVADAARVLKPGGHLVFQVQSRDAVQEVDPPWDNFRSIRYYTPAQAKALIAPPLLLVDTRGRPVDHDFFVTATKSA